MKEMDAGPYADTTILGLGQGSLWGEDSIEI